MKRYAQIVRLKPEALEEYKRIHAAVWPEVLETIRQCNIRNYSIFHREGILYAYFEYFGSDLAADMAKMARDPKTQEWWKVTDPMQERVPGCPEGQWWAPLDEVFHTE
jgi:L-rhamnose mutarotase